MLRVRLLGELQAEVDGESLAMPPASRRAWALLAWLALHPGEHPRGAVAARFWPDVLDTSARASLRSALWELRRALGERDALIAGRERIALHCETDLAEFDAHVAAGRLEAAVALHRGPLLADLDDDWVLEARDEHAERLGSALARLAAAAASPADAVGWARRRLALDPLDEDAARDLMRRLADAGDRPAALAAYDRLSDRLRGTLGLAPSGETRRLAAAIREEGAAPAEDGSARERAGTPEGQRRSAQPPGDAAADGPALVGRDSDLAELVGLWDIVRAGRGGVAVIGGEAGIGKTRLALELLARARAAGRARRALHRRRPRRRGRRSRRGSSCSPGSRASSSRRPPTPSGRRSSRGWRRRCRCGWAGRASRRPRCRPTSPARGCSRRPSSWPSTRPRTGRSCCCSTTSISPTRRRSSSIAYLARRIERPARSCSCSRAGWCRAATRSTRSPTPRGAAASPCASSSWSR